MSLLYILPEILQKSNDYIYDKLIFYLEFITISMYFFSISLKFILLHEFLKQIHNLFMIDQQ